ncbi:hypothetical protein FEM03_14985 [Phragmitibacter flavus]|uniref:Uncharacterized protein n=1 Tax=Phragmitibacter flavus TaxID=2576071 RepID=A0A5R8KCL7_9BACT|nr:hypothetical protein [Phragmitibacter flavus]TLD70031.1 hypothetical protein FEM03_14985 [Phragmitibacter flavus]
MTAEPTANGDQIIERNLGQQPIDTVLTELQLNNHDLVALCGEGLTHKAMQRARKGRRLTPKMKVRITETLNIWIRAQNRETQYRVRDLFNY